MRIPDRLADRTCFSFEFFPPKTTEGATQLFDTLRDLVTLNPGFVSITYGAGGSARDRTIEIATTLKRETKLEPLAHLAVCGHTSDEISTILNQLHVGGIENVLCLRGDAPNDNSGAPPNLGDFKYASDLIEFVRANRWPFALGAACYPEKHPESLTLADDLAAAKRKVALGAEFLVTQLFFGNEDYFDFVKAARAAGIGVPIVPGIMPITNVKQIERFAKMCGARIPDDLQHELMTCDGDHERVLEIGVAHATRQCRDLIIRGAPGVHFYTLNRSRATRNVVETLIKEGLY